MVAQAGDRRMALAPQVENRSDLLSPLPLHHAVVKELWQRSREFLASVLSHGGRGSLAEGWEFRRTQWRWTWCCRWRPTDTRVSGTNGWTTIRFVAWSWSMGTTRPMVRWPWSRSRCASAWTSWTRVRVHAISPVAFSVRSWTTWSFLLDIKEVPTELYYNKLPEMSRNEPLQVLLLSGMELRRSSRTTSWKPASGFEQPGLLQGSWSIVVEEFVKRALGGSEVSCQWWRLVGTPQQWKQTVGTHGYQRILWGREKGIHATSLCPLDLSLEAAAWWSARQFMTRWDTAERKVREHDVKCPADFLGFLMVNALQLDSEKTKLLLNFTKGSLKVSDVKEWLRIHETDLDLSNLGNDKKKANTYLLDKEATKEIQYVDIPQTENESEDEPAELLLATLADLEDPENAHENDPVILTQSETKGILMTMVKDHRSKGRSYSRRTVTWREALELAGMAFCVLEPMRSPSLSWRSELVAMHVASRAIGLVNAPPSRRSPAITPRAMLWSPRPRRWTSWKNTCLLLRVIFLLRISWHSGTTVFHFCW